MIRRGLRAAAAAAAVLPLAAPGAAEAQGVPKVNPSTQRLQVTPPPSGAYQFREADLGTRLTECPQAGLRRASGPLDRRRIDEAERRSSGGDDVRANQDYACFPQNETAVAFNPRLPSNLLGGANDYRLGTAVPGFYASTDRGRTFYDGIIPFPSGPASGTRGEGVIPSGGDPVTVFDRDGVAYYAQIAFFRGDDTNAITVQRSTNGGFTWSRACFPTDATPDDPTDDEARCVAQGDARQPGDGVVTFNPDDNGEPDGSMPFDDKEWLAAGPRPDGVEPRCFTPFTRTATECDPDVVGVDRLYVTFTRFTLDDNEILMAYSDDEGRSWSQAEAISGASDLCDFSPTGTNRCDFNQSSVPTVNPATGHLWVAFENFNTPDENQYLVVRSTDGGETFDGPFHVSPVFDMNFPRAGLTRPDCTARGQQAFRIVYTNSCFRSNSFGNIVADRRGGAFADDLYVVLSDNRNGTTASSNADVFLFKSTDGGETWIGPSRVNTDRSVAPGDRDCGREEGFLPDPEAVAEDCDPQADHGNDQFWPWVDIGRDGTLAVGFSDRRLDRASEAHEWPESRSRPGNYLVWFWGAGCRVRQADSRECLAPGAVTEEQPTGPVDPPRGEVPGQGAQAVARMANQKVSDVGSNYDYAFRTGTFAGDYNNVAVRPGSTGGASAVGFWTDARNGRSSRNQPGRNPICEQSDVFLDAFNPLSDAGGRAGHVEPFLVTPCPRRMVDPL